MMKYIKCGIAITESQEIRYVKGVKDKIDTVEAQLYGVSYLHDFSKFSLGVGGEFRNQVVPAIFCFC